MADHSIYAEDEEDCVALHENEWRRLQQAMHKDGLRSGLSEGQERRLQGAFNERYASASAQAFHLAKLRGILSAILGHHLLNPQDEIAEWQERLENAISKISTLESDLSHPSIISFDATEEIDVKRETVSKTAEDIIHALKFDSLLHG
ncbi:hypothetical protein CAPTEDRAFT_224896 [Capitella teleta]|uniref:Uncharacterized protein n=1 Tax=Capitella teleta TaxID=283909 RepID=R7VJU9_CAPTE|nr:hypothetical protein CAPTEDRAFT_224896 [Capitella teleta]|eukprot:ELU16210.1 hypothetical protein CAPTEDRAFT_224896 [Capitella teleta]